MPPNIGIVSVRKPRSTKRNIRRYSKKRIQQIANRDALKIRYDDPTRLRPRLKNPRTHTAKQIEQIAASIKQFGFINPILIDGGKEVIAGHESNRLAATFSAGISRRRGA